MDQQYVWVHHLPACAIFLGALLLLGKLIRMRLRNRSRR